MEQGVWFSLAVVGRERSVFQGHASKREMENVKSPGGQSSSELLNHFPRLTFVGLGILRLYWYVWK